MTPGCFTAGSGIFDFAVDETNHVKRINHSIVARSLPVLPEFKRSIVRGPSGIRRSHCFNDFVRCLADDQGVELLPSHWSGVLRRCRSLSTPEEKEKRKGQQENDWNRRDEFAVRHGWYSPRRIKPNDDASEIRLPLKEISGPGRHTLPAGGLPSSDSEHRGPWPRVPVPV